MIRAGLVWLLLSLPAAAQAPAPQTGLPAQQSQPAAPAQGDQALPDWQKTSVNDFAHLLTPEDARTLDQALIKLFRETDIEGTVVTLTDRDSYGGSDGLEAFATRLFNHWGVGDATRNDGFMVLVLNNDHEARIELGAGYPAWADPVAGEILDQQMLPAFRAGRMSEGIREGTLAVIDRIARPIAAEGDLAPRRRSLSSWLPGVIAVAFFGFVIFNIARDLIRRALHRRRPCPNCGGRGLVEEIEPITAETETGQTIARQSVWTLCPRCGWKAHQLRDAPNRDRMNRRGGGGFGGGRSSGGGASGRW